MATEINTNIEALKNKKVLAYPLSLGGLSKNAVGVDNQFMMIKIQTSDKSSPLKDDKTTGVVVTPNPGGGGTGIGVISQPITFVDPTTRLLFGDAIKNENWVQKPGMTRLDKVIVLPMPNDYKVNTTLGYNRDYDPSSLTKAGDMMANMGFGMAKDLMTTAGNAAASGVINGIKKGIVGGGDVTTPEQLAASEKLIANPKKEVMYTGFSFREFAFQYTFAPKSKIESETVAEIIQTLRYYSLPELRSGKQYYIFPSEFEIIFMMGNQINPNIPRIATSVLQRIGVDYSPGGNIWSTLPNGAPVAIMITLEFLETELIDRTRVWKKDSPVTSGY